MDALTIRGVKKGYMSHNRYKTQALDGVDLTVSAGEFVGIMGPSGSGKTTLLNVASGIDRCDEGGIFIHGHDLSKLGKMELSLFRRGNIGLVFQDFNLLNSLTVRENILTPLVLDHKLYEVDETDIKALVEILDLQEILDKYPYEISGGEKQRTAICRAIINNPKIIFADEPTGNLDSKMSENILSYFDTVHTKYGVSIVLVTHDPFSACHCQRIVFLKDGKNAGEIVREGDKHAFFEQILAEMQGAGELRK